MPDVGRQHADALLTLLAGVHPNLGVHDAEVPDDAPTPYVVQYPDGGTRMRSSLTADHQQVTSAVQWTCVGASRDEALWAADRALNLLGATPTVPGRACWPLTQAGATQVRRDDTSRTPAGRPLFLAVVDVQLTSTPA